MFAGHYAPAFALRSRSPDVPLWQLFVAVQAVDILFFVLVPLGIEQAAVDPTRPGLLALRLLYMPWSHSLLAAVVYAALIVGIGRSRSSAVLALAVASHWLVDLPVHTPDLPLAAGDGVRVGLGLWAHPVAAWALEVGLLAAGFGLYGREARRGAWLFLLLAVVQTLNTFVVPLPASNAALSALSEGSYALFAALAWRLERAPAAATVAATG